MSLSPQTTIRVANTITWDPPEVAGGRYVQKNGDIVYFHGSGVHVLEDILGALQLKENMVFAEIADSFKSVANGSADIGSLLLSHELSWKDYGLGTSVVFLQPLARIKSHAFFRQAPSENLKIGALRPFTLSAWLIYLLFTLLISVTIYLSSNCNPGKCLCLSNALSILIEALTLCAGNTRFISTNNGSRWFSWVVSILSVIMLSLYTAKILVVFAAIDDLVVTPEDLLKYNYKLSTYSPTHINRLFRNTRLKKQDLVSSITIRDYSSIAQVIGKGKRDPRYALLTHPDGFYPQALFALNFSREMCLVSSFKSVGSTPKSMYMWKNSSFRNDISLKIVQYIERGLNLRFQRNFERKYKFQCPPKHTDVNAVSFHHASFAFLVLITGACLALFLNCIESRMPTKST